MLTNLSSDYGRIFNAPNPDISLWEATQRNKIIFVTLPTMDSDTTPKELGRLLLGLIKGVAAQKAKFAKEPKIPFTCFLDELGSYVIEGFGRLESKSRSLGISIFPFFQSPAQIDVVAKNDYERKEIIANGKLHRAIAQAESSLLSMGKKTTYQGMSDEKIPLTQYVSKREFFKRVKNILCKIENLG